jgi:selenocysteine lyase/cysteine desulfurase
MQLTFDAQAVREQFPALGRTHNGRGVVYFDGPGGSQVARQAIEAITDYMERGGANLHGVFPTSTETEEILADTRMAAADFLGAAPDEVAFGANMTTLTFAVSRALASGWDRDSEISSQSSTTALTWTPGSSPQQSRGRECAGSG